MPKLPRVSGRECIQALERLGFRHVRQRGSHVVMRKETPEGSVGRVVPQHDLVDPGTLRGILRQAKVSVEEFVAVL